MRFETPMQNRETPRHFWPERWWALVDFRIGIIPLPVYVLLVFIIILLVRTDEVKSDAPTMIAVLVLGGFTCAELGARDLLRAEVARFPQQAVDGLDNDGANGVDDVGERETTPPYDKPLRGMQVLIRTYERDSRAIRQVRVNQHFMPE